MNWLISIVKFVMYGSILSATVIDTVTYLYPVANTKPQIVTIEIDTCIEERLPCLPVTYFKPYPNLTYTGNLSSMVFSFEDGQAHPEFIKIDDIVYAKSSVQRLNDSTNFILIGHINTLVGVNDTLKYSFHWGKHFIREGKRPIHSDSTN